uniref:Uncharacterized protein n=1 Tax=Podoviridae sp. ctz6O13 TaxID=2827757 RepID=A0A8S5TKG5_9CAUD|nr:MAG TPA: hypothetical protein [Podoviridae sp. ctz6O13]
MSVNTVVTQKKVGDMMTNFSIRKSSRVKCVINVGEKLQVILYHIL